MPCAPHRRPRRRTQARRDEERDDVARRGGDGASRGWADQRSARPGCVHEAEGHALRQAASLRSFRDQRERRGEEHAVRSGGSHEQRHVDQGAWAESKPEGKRGAGGE